jgi:hypothetical protein
LSTAASNRSQASGSNSTSPFELGSCDFGFVMSNPWDITPLPEKGDDIRQVTAAAKGEATGAWELAEVHLSQLFAAVRGKRTDAMAKLYGEPLNFKDRLDGLERAGWAYFRRHCDQALEADFEDVVLLARMLSLRRNEIVHSIVQGIPYSRDYKREGDMSITTFKMWFFIVPPSYNDRKWDPFNQPSFIYSSKEIDHYAAWFNKMGTGALNLALRLSDVPIEPYGRRHHELQP